MFVDLTERKKEPQNIKVQKIEVNSMGLEKISKKDLKEEDEQFKEARDIPDGQECIVCSDRVRFLKFIHTSQKAIGHVDITMQAQDIVCFLLFQDHR